MEMSAILKPEAVRVISSASSKKRLLQELADTAASVYGIDAGSAVIALQERENLGPTGVGKGVALPHARVAGLNEVVGVFVSLEKPIDFSSVDKQPVDLAFALFAPSDAGVEHLKALARVSRALRDADRCTKLRSNKLPSTLYTIITEEATLNAA
ncbi:PTS sugar transporter subunit IIA [Lentibacter algarum]|uniref:PTS sugar transporter subunit IIA n=1 Tax=Lentibacter algarum TaxID=576131 RepID=UPI001C066C37|nr:PTS sugar transporter subunit IIA [Lentibacter algarum]MBU2981049.1 PTS sugar transporter subunit IIA [Lentibacter algarum]